jgi:hypothetical protein
MAYTTQQVRDRALHSISPSVAGGVGVSMGTLTQFAMGYIDLAPAQVDALARMLGVADPRSFAWAGPCC